MLRVEKRTIGKRTYQITTLGAAPGRRMLIRLLKILGPSITAALESKDGTLSLTSGAGLSRAVSELCERLTPDEFEEICQVFFEQTEVSKDAGGFIPLNNDAELKLCLDYADTFKLLTFHLETNYSSFLGGLKATAP